MGFTFTDISYQTHIAASLLQIQQAQARVEARKKIVEGSVTITHEAIDRLNTQDNFKLEKEDTSQLAKALMCLTCSDQGSVQAVININ